MRFTALSLISILAITYFVSDRQAASFFTHFVTTNAAVAAVATELWSFTKMRVWMLVASIFIQVAAIGFCFIGTAVLSQFLTGRLAFIVACLPLAGALMAWHHYRGYVKILKLNSKCG